MEYSETGEAQPIGLTLPLKCESCASPLMAPIRSAVTHTQCPVCRQTTVLSVFPALIHETQAGRDGETLTVDDDSSCFYHTAKKAVVACAYCGRFLCALCDIDMNRRHLCPSCIEAGAVKGKMTELRSEVTHYDEVALAFAVYPMVFFWPTAITSFITIFIVLWKWRKPHGGLVPRGRWRFLLAFVIAILQVAGWITVATMLFAGGK